MGTPKALLPFDGLPLIAHIVDRLQSIFPEVLVVAAPDQELPRLTARIVHDDVAYQGPVSGIYTGLKDARHEVAFVTSCDSAFLNPALIRHLVSRCSDCDVVVPRWEERFQPLHAVYRKSVAPLLGEQLARGQLRPVFLFDKVRTCTIEEDEVRAFDPDGASFFNMNTPEDSADAQVRWAAHRERGVLDARAPLRCTAELFGVAQMVAGTREVALDVPPPGTFGQAVRALADALPPLVGRVIRTDRAGLVDGYACSVNGLRFIHSPQEIVQPGDALMILSADAGG